MLVFCRFGPLHPGACEWRLDEQITSGAQGRLKHRKPLASWPLGLLASWPLPHPTTPRGPAGPGYDHFRVTGGEAGSTIPVPPEPSIQCTPRCRDPSTNPHAATPQLFLSPTRFNRHLHRGRGGGAVVMNGAGQATYRATPLPASRRGNMWRQSCGWSRRSARAAPGQDRIRSVPPTL